MDKENKSRVREVSVKKDYIKNYDISSKVILDEGQSHKVICKWH